MWLLLTVLLSLLGQGFSSCIWRPTPGTTWQWQITQTINTSLNVDMYDIDLYEATASDIATLKAAGKIVICYFSAGSAEDFRADYSQFPAATLGSILSGYPDEKWVDIRDSTIRQIMMARLDYAQSRGCDGVEPDNMDAYDNNNGLGLTPAHQLDYNKFISREAHKRGLSVGLKNDLAQVNELVDYFDWALNEECLDYTECPDLQPFLDQNKAVFHVEYVNYEWQGNAKKATVCSSSGRPSGFSTLIKLWDLDSWRLVC
ncbi:uncharacterized protein LOC135475801 [Liolophura sinensis]|uniref:uncharacterized protein LOC135475801 n=1 Tax=Liolophura sinensis TaxID=3198878 RepID=UPI00315857C3